METSHTTLNNTNIPIGMLRSNSDTDILELIVEIRKLRTQVENLEDQINNTKLILVNHISFIDSVFNTIKRPLFFVMNKVNNILLLEN